MASDEGRRLANLFQQVTLDCKVRNNCGTPDILNFFKGLPPLVTELMARGGRLTADDQDGGNVGDNVGDNVGGNVGDVEVEDDGNHCVRLAEQLRLTAESLAAFISSVDRFF